MSLQKRKKKGDVEMEKEKEKEEELAIFFGAVYDFFMFLPLLFLFR